MAHEIRLISPQFVKPYVRGQKNNMQDAAAICEAASRPEMRFAPQKSIAQQRHADAASDLQPAGGKPHPSGKPNPRVLAKYGIVVPLHLSHLRKYMQELTAEPHSQLTEFAQRLFAGLYDGLRVLDDRIAAMEKQIQEALAADEACQRIAKVEGVGPVIATVIVAAVADGKAFQNGRQVAAWLGLVPRQHSSGEKQQVRRTPQEPLSTA